MEPFPLDSAGARRLLGADTAVPVPTAWGDDELQVAWTHLLQLKMEAVTGLRDEAGHRIVDLLHKSGRQPVETLRAMKEWAQGVMREADAHAAEAGPIPPQAASILYHLAIVLAQVWHGVGISSMDNETLARGVRWASRQKWVDAESQAILLRWLPTAAG
jgi:hypothetical protein